MRIPNKQTKTMKNFISHKARTGLLFLLFGLLAQSGWGQVSITSAGTAFTQNFNTLAASGTSTSMPAGWYFVETGTGANTTYTAGTGSATSGDTWSFGASGNTERSLGTIQSTSVIPVIGGFFLNSTGSTISTLNITYVGEQWRLGATGRVDRLDFQYSLNATSLSNGTWTDANTLDFTAPITSGTIGAFDGNATANKVSISNVISGLSISNNSNFWIRWIDLNATGADDGLAVDDFSITASAGASSSSNIILNSSFTHPTNIDYTAYQAASGLTDANSIEVGKFDIQDGGGSSDADALSTTLTACTFSIANSSNIRALALFDGATNLGEITTVSATSAFSGLTLAAADNGSKTFSIRATFKSAVTDNQQISFAVASATASGSGSGFAAANAGAATTTTTGDNNRIEVATTDIIFDQNVSTVAQNAAMSPSPTIRAVDANANYDLDNTSDVVLTIGSGSTTFDASSTTTVSMVAGVATFSNLIFSTAANSNTLTATQGATSDASSLFNVTASAPEINVKQNVTSLASGSGSHAAGSIVSGNSGSAVTFTIENLGSANLTYSSISNSNTTDFTLNTTSSSSPIAASGSTTFTVTFNPTSAGAKSTTITINNNDADEGTYTFTVTGTGTVSAASDIITNGGYLYSSNIDYASFQTSSTLTTGNSVGVMGLIIQDGAGTADADNLGTTLTAISFTTGDSSAIRTAALFDGSTNVSEVAVNGATTISFSGLTLSAADASTKNFELRVTYQASVTDNQQITFTVSSASASATTSGFVAANAGAAISIATGDINRLEVTASTLAFVQQVSNVSVNTAMTSAPTVSANDPNGNRDLDYVTDMTATTTGTFAAGSTNTVTPTAGLGTFSNLQFSTAALARTIDVGSGILSNTGNSNTFNIFEAQPTVQASVINFTNVGMNSMTINWTNGDGANRIVVVKASGAPGISTDGVTYTANTIFGSGSTFGASEYVVYNGSGNTVDITNLLGSTTYSVKVFEYNGSAGTENYLTTSNNTSQTTISLSYYSNGSGDPAVLANWKTARNGTGSSPSNFTSGETFIIESGDIMTTTTTWSVSGTSSKLQIEDGGTLIANNAITLEAATTFQIDNGGTYIHNNTAAFATTIFAGTENFASNSIVEFRDWNTTSGPSIAVFGNLKVNPLGQPGSAFQLGSVTTTINGNLEVLASGTTTVRDLRLSSSSALSLTITGSLIISGNGSLDIASSAGTSVNRIINIGGNFIQTGGTVKCTGTSNPATVIFTGVGKTFTQSGGVLNNTNINWSIADGASLTLNNNLPVATNRSIIVGAGTSGTLVCGTNVVSGAGAFTLSPGATLKTANATGVNGSITVSGTITFSNAANFEFYGNTAQTTGTNLPSTVNNFTISNTAGVTLPQSVAVNGAMSISGTGASLTINPNAILTIAGTADFGGKSVTLKSDATGNAAIGQVTGSLTGATNVTVERYIPAKRAWRLLTAPLKGSSANTISSNWQGTANEGVLLFSPTPYQSNEMIGYTTGGSSPNIYKFGTTSWSVIPNLTTEPLFDGTVNNAFLVYGTGPYNSTNIASGETATTLKPKGELITGNVTYNSLLANKFKLIGNPYASPINPVTLVTSNPGYKIWMADPSMNASGGYVTYDGTNWSTPTPSGVNGYIQSGQGFFVRKSTDGSFAISETHKVSGSSLNWFERNTTTESADKIRVLLYKQDGVDWKLADGILAVNSLSGVNDVDDTDANKMSNFNENIMFRNGTTNLSIEYKALPTETDVQQLRLTNTSAQAYQLRVHTEEYLNSTLTPVLEDTLLGTMTPIPTDGSEVTVPFTGIVASSTNPDNRFRIVYQSLLGTTPFEPALAMVFPNPVKDNLTIQLVSNTNPATFSIANLVGQVIKKGSLNTVSNSISLESIQEGFYLVTISQNGKTSTSKIFVY